MSRIALLLAAATHIEAEAERKRLAVEFDLMHPSEEIQEELERVRAENNQLLEEIDILNRQLTDKKLVRLELQIAKNKNDQLERKIAALQEELKSVGKHRKKLKSAKG